MLIYLAMAIDLQPWVINKIDRIRRGFLWKGRKDVKGGHCQVAWPVCRPHELGGLGISDLQKLSWVLRMRWLWLKKTEPNHPWAEFPIHVHQCVRAFFSMVVISEVGDGACTFFFGRIDGFMVDVLLILPHICLLSFLRDEQINALFWKVSQTRHGSRICRVHFQ
jgi:hypothetical protein